MLFILRCPIVEAEILDEILCLSSYSGHKDEASAMVRNIFRVTDVGLSKVNALQMLMIHFP